LIKRHQYAKKRFPNRKNKMSLLKFRKPILLIERLEKNDLDFPKYATANSAGIDFSACIRRPPSSTEFVDSNEILHLPPMILHPGEVAMIPLGFKVQIEDGYVMKLYVRSSIGKKGLVLANGTGIIDSDYRGELFACMRNCTDEFIEISHGDRIVQAVIQKYSQCEIVEGKVDETIRGEGGFGSTGK
jgi:dUTP pyrophosphatase